MGPGGVVTGEHHQVGEVEVLIAAGHQVGAEGQLVGRHRRGHAEPGIGVDIPRSDEALHQLVGGVIVLGEQLAGDVEGHRVRAVAGGGLGEAPGHQGRGLGPAGLPFADHRGQQAALEAYRGAQGPALGAEPAGIGRVRGVAGDGKGAALGDPARHAAAHPAIGAGGGDGGGAITHFELPSTGGEPARVGTRFPSPLVGEGGRSETGRMRGFAPLSAASGESLS